MNTDIDTNAVADPGRDAASRAPIVIARGVTKTFLQGRLEVPALRGVDLEVREGEFLALVGPSGSG